MLIAIYSDIHGNLPALEIAIKHTGLVDTYLILGDVVNYGPWSNECVDLINTLKSKITIMGNHEEYFIEGKCDVSHDIVRQFFLASYAGFTKTNLIRKYVKSCMLENKLCSHTIGNRKIFKDTYIAIDQDHIIGHSHQQFISQQNEHLIINPGSIGQNRKQIDEINFTIFDSEKNLFYEKQVKYKVQLIINEMKARKYPKVCVEYYEKKLG